MMEEMMIRLFNMSFAGGCTAGIVALLRLFLRRMPRSYSYALWLVVLFRFLCPVTFTSSLSWFPVNPEPMRQEIIYQENPSIDTGVIWVDRVVNHGMSESLAVENPENSINPIQVWLSAGFVIWGMGFFAFTGYYFWQWIRLRRSLATAVQGDSQPSAESQEKGTGRTGNKIPVWESDRIGGAFVSGLLRPAIYLPAGLSGKGREYILCHERIHVRRGDYLVRLLGLGMVAVHWFNPLAWLAFRLMCTDMEMSCDEKVLQIIGEEMRESYSRVLLAEAEKQSRAVLPPAFGRSDTYLRIRNILHCRKPGHILTWGMIFLLAAAGIGLITNPVREKEIRDKEAESVSIIGGADGPTSIFLAGKVAGSERNMVWQRDLPDPEWLSSVMLIQKAGNGEDSGQTESLGIKKTEVFLDFASENSLIFHGDFGLFSFNREENGSWKQQIFIKDVNTASELSEALGATIPPGQEMSRDKIHPEDSFRLTGFREGPDSRPDCQVREYAAAKMSDGRIAVLGAVLPEGEDGRLLDLFYGYYEPSKQVMTQVFLFQGDGQERINLKGEIRLP